jgi:hypothetical protein
MAGRWDGEGGGGRTWVPSANPQGVPLPGQKKGLTRPTAVPSPSADPEPDIDTRERRTRTQKQKGLGTSTGHERRRRPMVGVRRPAHRRRCSGRRGGRRTRHSCFFFWRSSYSSASPPWRPAPVHASATLRPRERRRAAPRNSPASRCTPLRTSGQHRGRQPRLVPGPCCGCPTAAACLCSAAASGAHLY